MGTREPLILDAEPLILGPREPLILDAEPLIFGTEGATNFFVATLKEPLTVLR